MEKGIHLKGLNGIRFFAALSVLLSHTFAAYEQLGFKRIVEGWDIADYGVTMFFTLSGFLITWLLHKEKAAFGTISISKFYIRRILRIWPLYYFFILLVLIIAYHMKFPAGLSYYLFMAANIPFVSASWLPLLSHYWSLAVEEQFYLFWPWLLKWFPPIRSITLFLIFFLMLKGILRIWIPETAAYQFMVITRFDCMAIGGLAAVLLNGDKRFTAICFGWPAQLLSWIIVLLAVTGYFKLPGFINHDVFALACAVIIVNVAFNKNPLVGLNYKLFEFLGRISYGIYIYHVLIIYLLGLVIKGRLLLFDGISQLILVIFAVVVSTILVAWLSFELLEKPFLRLKHQFSKVTSRS